MTSRLQQKRNKLDFTKSFLYLILFTLIFEVWAWAWILRPKGMRVIRKKAHNVFMILVYRKKYIVVNAYKIWHGNIVSSFYRVLCVYLSVTGHFCGELKIQYIFIIGGRWNSKWVSRDQKLETMSGCKWFRFWMGIKSGEIILD